jgi:DNA-binding transcriptional MerR regulator
MNSQRAADRVGITYRQLDHWIRQGYIRASLPGSGNPRDISGAEAEVLRYMAALVSSGVQPTMAAHLARRLAAGETVHLGFWQLGPVTAADRVAS